MIPEVYNYSEDSIEVAIIDRTYANDTKVILIDKPEKYIQRFWIDGSDKELVDKCRQMRKLKIPSL